MRPQKVCCMLFGIVQKSHKYGALPWSSDGFGQKDYFSISDSKDFWSVVESGIPTLEFPLKQDIELHYERKFKAFYVAAMNTK
ncbi:hypothetical protein CMV_012165 [Castanea mollissima]|uniref:Uncharacterized protein n=1 Tax=Castanea mollissima TaxID=60419 RepID=A0A8J4RG59_9ROSI|nr:hypothetical protein CMV_012165 [Castanea mollissima]